MCLTGLIDTALKDKSSVGLRCPHLECNAPLSEAEIRIITRNNHLPVSAYADITTNEYLTTQRHAKRCSTPNCSYAFINDDEQRCTTQCPKCEKSYCSACLTPHEQSISCDHAKNQLDSTTRWLHKNTKRCPSCKAHIQRSVGCDHMTCKNCRYEFCYNCNAPFRNDDGTSHPSYCPLKHRIRTFSRNHDPEIIADDGFSDRGAIYCHSTCCLACLMGGLLLISINPQQQCLNIFECQNQYDASRSYQRRFSNLNDNRVLTQRYYPNLLKAGPEQETMMDDSVVNPVCAGLAPLEHKANHHHTAILRDVFHTCYHTAEYSRAVVQSSDQYSNIVQIASAKKKRRHAQEDKKST